MGAAARGLTLKPPGSKGLLRSCLYHHWPQSDRRCRINNQLRRGTSRTRNRHRSESAEHPASYGYSRPEARLRRPIDKFCVLSRDRHGEGLTLQPRGGINRNNYWRWRRYDKSVPQRRHFASTRQCYVPWAEDGRRIDIDYCSSRIPAIDVQRGYRDSIAETGRSCALNKMRQLARNGYRQTAWPCRPELGRNCVMMGADEVTLKPLCSVAI